MLPGTAAIVAQELANMRFPEAARLAGTEVRLLSAGADGAQFELREPGGVVLGAIALWIKNRKGKTYLKGEFSLDAARSLPVPVKSAFCANLHAWLSQEVTALDWYEIGDDHDDVEYMGPPNDRMHVTSAEGDFPDDSGSA